MPMGLGYIVHSLLGHSLVGFLHEAGSHFVLRLIVVFAADIEIKKEDGEAVEYMPEAMRADAAHIIAEYFIQVHFKQYACDHY